MSSRSQGSLASRTTIAGSLPKPGWLATRDQPWAGWLHEGEVLAEASIDQVSLEIAGSNLPLEARPVGGEECAGRCDRRGHRPRRVTRPVAAVKMSALARGAALVSSAR